MEENAQAWLNFIFLLLKWKENILLKAGVVTRGVRYSIYERAWNMLRLGSRVLNGRNNQLQNLGVVQYLLWNPDILSSSILWEFAIWNFRRYLKIIKDLTNKDWQNKLLQEMWIVECPCSSCYNRLQKSEYKSVTGSDLLTEVQKMQNEQIVPVVRLKMLWKENKCVDIKMSLFAFN